MTNEDFKALRYDLNLKITDACCIEINKRINYALRDSKRPFEDLSRWGGFIVLGPVRR